jgi:polyketide biosynthesis 3-hydroxy-3-methylglutaryl-CoA synthase-like enzyme PksG
MLVGIDAIHAYCGSCFIDVKSLFRARGLSLERFSNLMMESKSVAAPWEDPVTHAVNAARPLVQRLSVEERANIEMVIVASESGLDFSKSLANYVHEYLQLSRQCRCFEIKQACYGATAALQMAAHYVAVEGSKGTRVLVIATDVSSDIHGHISAEEREPAEGNYAEPSLGTGSVAMLVSANPRVLAIDLGASGLCSYEVMDTCRPVVGREAGAPDLSLLSYMDCLEACVKHYLERLDGCDLEHDFRYLLYHTPFAGMVAAAH